VLNVGPQAPLPIGIGYLGWQLEQTGAPALQFLNVALEYKVKAVWLSAGERLPEWIAHIRNNEATPGAVKIFIQVGSVEQALVAVNDWKADVVVLQGNSSLPGP
jgi:nitronate monooxygenase